VWFHWLGEIAELVVGKGGAKSSWGPKIYIVYRCERSLFLQCSETSSILFLPFVLVIVHLLKSDLLLE